MLISLFAALTAVGAFIKIPIPYVPFTMQFFFSSLSGLVLGAGNGALSQLLYLLIGLIGIPVFSNGGGPQYIFQPTFGYLLGLILASYTIGKLTYNKVNDAKIIFLANMLALIIIYILGGTYFYIINRFYLKIDISIMEVIKYGVLINFPGDMAKVVIVSITGKKLSKVLKTRI